MKKVNLYLIGIVGLLILANSVQASRIIDADLEITLERNSATLIADQALEITVTVTNHGPDDAENVAVELVSDSTHELESFVLGDVGGEGWTCTSHTDENSIIHMCTRVSLESGTESVIHLNVQQGVVNEPASFSLQVSAVSETEDLDESNNSGYLVVPIGSGIADLAIEMSSDLQVVSPEEDVSYALTAENLGPDTAENVNVLLNLPEGMSVSETRGDGWSCLEPENEGDGTLCQLDSLNADETRELFIDAIAPSSGEELLASASITSNAYDPVVENNSDVYDLGLAVERADLAVALESETAFASHGDLVNVVASVENLAGTSASNVQLMLNLPEGIDVQSTAGEGWMCVGNLEEQSQICTRDGLSPGEHALIEFQLRVGESLVDESISLYASLSSDAYDENGENDGAPLSISILTERADLAITGSIESDVVLVGEPVTFSINVENLGSTDANELLLLSTLPSNANLLEQNDGDWSCSSVAEPESQTLVTSCELGSLAAGTADNLALSFTFDESVALEDLTHAITISSSLPDPNLENNTARIQSRVVNTQADLVINVERTADVATAGTEAIFNINVVNGSSNPATGVMIQLIPPIGVDVSAITGEGWSCEILDAEENSTGRCALDGLDPGSTQALTVNLFPRETFDSESLELTARVQGEQYDPAPENNTSVSDIRYIPASADLAIEQEVSFALDEAIARYNLTITNHGPDDATNVAVTNVLPFLARWIGLEDSNWSCDPDTTEGLTVLCTLSSLPVGTSATLSYEIDISEFINNPSMLNFVMISSDLFDPLLSNNSLFKIEEPD